jgi:hypothetical protein
MRLSTSNSRWFASSTSSPMSPGARGSASCTHKASHERAAGTVSEARERRLLYQRQQRGRHATDRKRATQRESSKRPAAANRQSPRKIRLQ